MSFIFSELDTFHGSLLGSLYSKHRWMVTKMHLVTEVCLPGVAKLFPFFHAILLEMPHQQTLMLQNGSQEAEKGMRFTEDIK